MLRNEVKICVIFCKNVDTTFSVSYMNENETGLLYWFR